MRTKNSKSKQAIRAAILGSLILTTFQSVAADQELLDILLSNGSITKEQHDNLSTKVSEKASETDELMKKMAWAGKIKIKGDLRLRQEIIDDSGGAGDNRQRYRARIGVYGNVTDSLKAGVRIASAGGATSTNETLGDGFANDAVFFDLAYMNWQVSDNVELIGGKFKKPWQSVSGGLLWDGDTNPEGLAIRYNGKVGDSRLIATAGHLVLDDVGNLSFSSDQRVAFGQLATKFKTDSFKGKAGIGLYNYDANDQTGALITGGGNTATEFNLQELFAEVKFKPVKLYTHLIRNADANGANSGEDTAWLIGAGAKKGKLKGSIDYRKTELNAVNGAFNDSDFAGGRTDSKGYRLKVGYKIDKNFSFGGTYIDSETGNLNGNRDIDILQLDLKAKF